MGLGGRYAGDVLEYQALYRKYRPQTFDEVIGQGHVTTTLAREVAEGRVAHAYLFAGPRGVGKTSTARILAKALNCRDRNADGSPDNTCPSCLAVTEGTSLDVLELDAASHNSVDDIRDIKVSVATVASAPTSKRVFVLDEAHMLSRAAGNALLKTLEEPPDHVHFVLATTEPYKLLDTIRSRAQRFDFRPLATDDLAGYLSAIADKESYKADPAALIAISRHAAGSARDSLSLLEQVSALGAGEVGAAGVRRALGLADSVAFMRLAEAVAGQDAKAALELAAELSADGVDLRRFVGECVGFFRGVFLAHYAPNLAEVSDEPAEVYESWVKAAELIPAADVLRGVDLLGETLVRIREGREERLMTELAFIKLTRPETAADPEALIARMDRIERRLGKPGEMASGAGAAAAAAPVDSPADEPASAPPPESPSASPSEAAAGDGVETAAIDISLEQLQKIWPGLFGGLRDLLGARRWALFREAVPAGVDGNTIILEIAHDFHLNSLQQDGAVTKIVETKASDLFGAPVKVRFRLKDGGPGPAGPDDKVDLTQLEERPHAETDPAALLAAELGAEVVDDQ